MDLNDETEDLWRTYYANTFNPARLKIKAMQSEMPKKYWKNLPEADLIAGMIAQAEARVRQMQDTAPSLPHVRAAKILARLPDRSDEDQAR
jgi:DNA polymerase